MSCAPAAPQQQRALQLPGRRIAARAGADQKETNKPSGKGGLPEDDVDEGLIGAVGTWILWAGLLAYTFYIAPNQTPLRDSYFLEKLSGFGSDDGVVLNPILLSIFFLDRVLPPIYGALLSPSAKNGNWLPSWPFLYSAMLFGSFSLLPYFAMWEPSAELPEVPPPRDADMSPVLRVTESPLFAGALILLSGALLAEIGLASGQQWYQFGRLLNESRLVHVTALDLFTLTFSLPFWMYNDADARGLKQQQILPLLIALPVIGPAIYLLLRPKAGAASE